MTRKGRMKKDLLKKYEDEFKRYHLLAVLMLIFTLLGLVIEVFFVIKKSQEYLLNYSIADSLTLLGNPFIFSIAICLPFVVILCLLLLHDFDISSLLRNNNRKALWYRQSILIIIASFIWSLIVGGMIILIAKPFVSDWVNWNQMTSFFFYKTGKLVEFSFLAILLRTLINTWALLLFIGTILLIVYWITDDFMICFFVVFLILGICQFPQLFFLFTSYKTITYWKSYIVSLLGCFFLWWAIIDGVAKMKLINRKDFYGKDK